MIKKLIIILGPTASGKSNLAIKLAKKFNGEIISADSRQIYKGMGISNDVIKNKKGIPHHMLAITTPDKTITLAEYRDMAMKKIEKIYKKGKIPVLVGGTGLYIGAIIQNYDIPRVAPDKKLREKLEKQAKKYGPAYIHKKLDPETAATIHPNNVRYIIRAIEKSVPGHYKKHKKTISQKFNTILVGIKIPREKLYERIEKRVDQQIKKGLITEVKKLIKKYNEKLPAMSSLGVKEIIPYIKGKSTLEQCAEILKRNTRRYAKRQMTWFRRYDDVKWLTPEDIKNKKWQKLLKTLKP